MWTYTTSVKWAGSGAGKAGADGRPALTVTPPEEFGGTTDQWNPELMLVSAVESCMLLTTLSVAQRQKLGLRSYESEATGHMEKTADGLRFTKIEITVRISVGSAEEIEKAEKAAHIAEKYCPVSNAVKIPVTLTVKASAG